jgi:hypothetical protein
MRTWAQWRRTLNALPHWRAVYQQSRRRIKAGVFKSLAHDLRAVLRIANGRKESPTDAIFDSWTLWSTPAPAMTESNAGKAIRSIWLPIRLGIRSPYAWLPSMTSL